MMPRILFVDDEERILRSLRMLFRGRCEILTTTSGREAIEWVRQRPVHVVVSDQRMPEIGGVEVLRAVAGHSPATMRILLTGYADMDAVAASVNEGEIYRFIEKPWDALRLIDTVEQAARIAQDGFAAPLPEGAPGKASSSPAAARILVLDDDGTIAAQVRELMPEAVRIEHATRLQDALAMMAENEIAVVVAQLSSAPGDVADALKQLKRLRPETLAIVVSPLRDSRLVIGLINEGQIFRFLLQPPPRELLRRGLLAALQRHAELRTDAGLLRRHAVEPSRGDASGSPGWLQQAWRRIRDATAMRLG